MNLNKTLQTESFMNFQNKTFAFHMMYFSYLLELIASPKHGTQQKEIKSLPRNADTSFKT